MTHDEKYPEHTKLRAVKDKSQALGEFIAWLEERDMRVCERFPKDTDDDGFTSDEEFFPAQQSTPQLLAEYFEIDLHKISAEKDAMVEDLIRQQP